MSPVNRFEPALQVLRDAIGARAFPGCAFGVVVDGAVVLEGALGRFTYEEDAPAVAVETVFDIASITKVVATTAAAMLLHQRGVLDLETPLGDLLPGFVIGRSAGESARLVTIRHLLAHSSGLPAYAELFRTAATADALLRACLQMPLEAEPGTRAVYSDIGFILLGKALEVLTGAPIDEWAAREIFEPLGMRATRFNPSPSQRAAIPPTEKDTSFRHRIIQGEVQDENASVLNGAAGHAGVFSTVHDLLLFAEEILSASRPAAGAGAKPRLFAPQTIALFAERQPPPGSSRALGWDTPSEPSSTGHHFSAHTIGHLGFSGCSLWIDRDAALAAALLTNRTWPDRQNRAIRAVWPLFHDAVRDAR